MNKKEVYDILVKLNKYNHKGLRKFDIFLWWTSLLFWMGRYDNALGFINNHLKSVSIIEFYCWKGALYYFLKDYIKASSFFEKAEAIDNTKLEIKYFLAETYFVRSEIEKAENRYRAIILDGTLKSFGLYGIGCCLMKKERIDEALRFFDKALKDTNEDLKVQILNKKGLCLMDLNKFEEAYDCFKMCLENLPNDDFIKINLALVLSKLGKYEEASQIYKNYLSKYPYDLTSINNLASCFAALGDFKQALEYCDRGLAIDPINGDLLANKGYCLYKLEDFKKALDCLKEAEKTIKDDIILLNNKALCLMALNDYDSALKIFNELLHKTQSDDILINKAHCLVKKEMYKEALECLQNINQKQKNSFDIYTLQGICFEKLGDTEKAIEYYNKSLIA